NFPAISASYSIAPVEKQLQTRILGGFFSRQRQKAATNQGFSAADSPEAPFWRSAAPFPLDIGWGLTRSFNSSTRRRNPRLCHNLSRRSIPVSCAICEKRKEKRFCPAVHGRICPQCCGEQREVTLDCPSDCPYLQQAREHEKPRPADQIDPEALFLQVEVPEQFMYEREHLLMGLSYALAKAAHADHSLNDRDLISALSALCTSYERLVTSGLHYEQPLTSSAQQRIAAEVESMLKE